MSHITDLHRARDHATIRRCGDTGLLKFCLDDLHGGLRLDQARLNGLRFGTAFRVGRSLRIRLSKCGAEALTIQARLIEAQAAVQIVKTKLEQTSISAPSDGRIIARTVEVGDVAQPGRKLLTLATTGETRLIAQIDEKNLSLLREGMRAIASADAFPDNKFEAELIYLAPSVDVTRGTVEARLRVGKPPSILRDDMTVSVEVVTAKKANVLSIPASALREAGERLFVLTVADGMAKEQDVRAGTQTGDDFNLLQRAHANAHVLLFRHSVGHRQHK